MGCTLQTKWGEMQYRALGGCWCQLALSARATDPGSDQMERRALIGPAPLGTVAGNTAYFTVLLAALGIVAQGGRPREQAGADESTQATFQQQDSDLPWDGGSAWFLHFRVCNGAFPGALAGQHSPAFKSIRGPWTLTPAPPSCWWLGGAPKAVSFGDAGDFSDSPGV